MKATSGAGTGGIVMVRSKKQLDRFRGTVRAFRKGRVLLALIASTALSAAGTAAPERESTGTLAVRRRDLGRTEKFRIMVDKVMTRPGPGEPEPRVMSDEIIREIAEAGFNVAVPRSGGDNPDRVRAVARRAGKQGLYTIAWLRGTLHLYDKGERWDKQRMTWPSGFKQDLYSPNMDRLWEVLTRQIVACAEISAEEPALLGVFLDYENYWDEGTKGDVPPEATLYGLSYDGKILREFAAARDIELPKLEPAERYPWLIEHGLHDAFTDFQVEGWRARCRALRQQVDALNPQFQFFLYPTPMESFFIEKAAGLEWSTPEAPFVVADWRTYGRPQPKVLPQDQALNANLGRLTSKMAAMRALDMPHRYISGIDPEMGGYTPGIVPALQNNDPEFCGRNAAMISEACSGYWVFYEGPRRGEPDHEAYMEWFGRANRAIVAGDYGFWKGKRETPDLVRFVEIEPRTDRIQMTGRLLGREEMIERTGKFEIHPLEGGTLEYLRQFGVVALVSFT